MATSSALVASDSLITPQMDRHNGRIFLITNLMIYLSAPAVYVGVVQAALCHELGASDAVANLPASTFLLGQFAPFVFSWFVPHRHEKTAAIWGARGWAALVIAVLLTLVIPLPAGVRIAALSVQGLLQGVVNSLVQVFSIQCLGRGTTEAGRAWAMKWTFSLGPIGAVAGSLAAQYILHNRLAWAPFPLNFALIYFMATPCIIWMAHLHTRWDILPMEDEPRPGFAGFFVTSFRDYLKSKALVGLFIAYALLMCSLSVVPTLALHTHEAMGQDPQSVTGWTLAMRFGCKAAAGYLLGMLAVRYGLRTSVMTCLAFLGAGVIWAAVAKDYWYLLAFGLMGSGELGGAYFPVYGLALSPLNLGPRNLSILGLATPAASFAPVLIGALKDRFGFLASLGFALGAAVVGAILIALSPKPETRA
jgi:MFS family permease